MPLLNKRRVPLSTTIPFESNQSQEEEAWYIQMTNEVFTNYDLYMEKLNLYQQPIWECESTGKTNLTYEQALESEKSEYANVAYKFSSTTRKVILNRVQFQTLPLDDIVEDIYVYLNQNFAVGEIVQCKLNNYEYYGRIIEIIQPDLNVPRESDGRLRFPDAFLLPEPKSSARIAPKILEPIIRIQLVDWNGRPIEEYIRDIPKSEIYREKSVLSRRNIKMFIQECCLQSTEPNPQWLLKPSIAAAYGVNLTKKRRFPEAISEGRGEEKKVRKDEQYTQRVKFKDEKKKKQQIKYPIEDLDLPVYRKDPLSDWNIIDMSPQHYDATMTVIPFPKAGKPERPSPHQESKIPEELYSSFLSAWAFMTVFAEPLKIAAFSLDEFEKALLHTTHQPKSTLLVEYNSGLLNIIINERDNDTANELINGDIMDDYVAALEEQEEESDHSDNEQEQKKKGSKLKNTIIEPSCASLPRVERGWRDKEGLKISQKWDHKELRANYHRRGWETSLIGCLNDVATPDLLPNVDELLQHLIPKLNSTAADREKQYPTLSIKQKLDILNFLISAVNESTPIKNYMEHCQEQLSELRKQKIGLNKDAKALSIKRTQFDKQDRLEKSQEASDDEETESEASGGESDNESAGDSDSNSQPRLSRQEKIKLQKEKKKEKEQLRKQQAAEQREALKSKNTEQRMKAKERQILEDSEKDIKKREEHLERSIRRYMTLRIRPIGKDRFYNRYYFLDNIGEADDCGSGRLFIHSPSDEDILLMMERDNRTDLPEVHWGYGGGRWFVKKLMEEQGLREESCWLERRMSQLNSSEPEENSGWWKYYSEPEEINQFIEWLNPKGVREVKLKNELIKLRPYIEESMIKRKEKSVPNVAQKSSDT